MTHFPYRASELVLQSATEDHSGKSRGKHASYHALAIPTAGNALIGDYASPIVSRLQAVWRYDLAILAIELVAPGDGHAEIDRNDILAMGDLVDPAIPLVVAYCLGACHIVRDCLSAGIRT